MEPSDKPEAATLLDKIVAVLDKAQRSAVRHPKLLESLKELHDATEVVAFFEAFMQPLCAALVVYKREPAAERVMEFVAKFAASVAPLELAPSPAPCDEEIVGKTGHSLSLYCSIRALKELS